MPVYDEGERLVRTLAELSASVRGAGATATVFLVDDGSPRAVDPDGLAPHLGDLTLVVARHEINLGQGAALETARRLALADAQSFEAFVTMDSDGQHRGADVLAVARAVVSTEVDVALGDRFAGGTQMPTSRRWLLRGARLFERLTTGVNLSDAHNGLRAFGPRTMAGMRLFQNRMAHATEITQQIARLRIVEVPVSVRYDDDVLAKGQRASGALDVVLDLLSGFLFGGRGR
jgi:glycosyltransferase involved in cell wall biosynthesis